MRKSCPILLCLLGIAGLFNSFGFTDVRANVASCSVNVSPSSVNTDTSQGFIFSMENTDSVSYQWIEVTRPSENFSITGYGIGEWSGAMAPPTKVTFTGSSLEALVTS